MGETAAGLFSSEMYIAVSVEDDAHDIGGDGGDEVFGGRKGMASSRRAERLENHLFHWWWRFRLRFGFSGQLHNRLVFECWLDILLLSSW